MPSRRASAAADIGTKGGRMRRKVSSARSRAVRDFSAGTMGNASMAARSSESSACRRSARVVCQLAPSLAADTQDIQHVPLRATEESKTGIGPNGLHHRWQTAAGVLHPDHRGGVIGEEPLQQSRCNGNACHPRKMVEINPQRGIPYLLYDLIECGEEPLLAYALIIEWGQH